MFSLSINKNKPMGPEEEKGGGEREGKEESHQRRRESDATY